MGIYDRDWYKQPHGKRPSAPPPGFVPPRRAPAGILSLVLLWLLIGGAITLMVRALVPGFGPVQVRAAQAGAVLLSPNRSGNYTLGGAINGVPVTFMVDTGASTLAVSAADADRMGLSDCQGVASTTANGTTSGCLALARQISFGPFSARNVRVAVLPRMTEGQALLGMNVLSRMQMLQQSGHMMLRPARP